MEIKTKNCNALFMEIKTMNREQIYIIGVYIVMLIAPCAGVAIGGIIAMLIMK
jgi:hypothetical protein